LDLGGVSCGSDSASDSDLDGDGSGLEKDKESFHEKGEIVDDIIAEDLEVRVETCAGVLLSRLVDNEVEQDLTSVLVRGTIEETYRNNGLVSGSTLFGEPFAETAKGDTSCSPDNDVGVIETGLDRGP
jgi:hypothetical protein